MKRYFSLLVVLCLASCSDNNSDSQDSLVLHGTRYTIVQIEIDADDADDFPFGSIFTASGINDAGQIVGTASCVDGCGYLLENGRLTRIDALALGGGFFQSANAINNRRQIVGMFAGCFTGIFIGTRGYLLEEDNRVTLFDFPGIPTQPACSQNRTFAFGINDAGQIVGAFFLEGDKGRHGFLRDGETFSRLDVPGATSTEAHGMNNAGHIVGTFVDSNGGRHGFLWVEGTFMVLDAPGATSTEADGINDADQIVGTFEDASGVWHGFLWVEGAFAVLDFPGTLRTAAHGINNLGQIVGDFRVTELVTKGYVATPAQ